MGKFEKDDLDILRRSPVPAPGRAARERAMQAALRSYEESGIIHRSAKGNASGERLIERTIRFWRDAMHKKLVATPAIAGLVALPVAGYVAWQVMEEWRPALDGSGLVETSAPERGAPPAGRAAENDVARDQVERSRSIDAQGESQVTQEQIDREVGALLEAVPAPPAGGQFRAPQSRDLPLGGQAASKLAAQPAPAPSPSGTMPEPMSPQAEDRDRFTEFETNPVRSALENPVSTFSIDVDTASYAIARRALREGMMPQRDSVRVEEMINYFPYDWRGPDGAETPFNTTISVMPTPWNEGTQLMHVAIKGYDVQPAEKPRSNLVFLIDTSGSMNETDKLPLLRNSFRLLVDRLDAEDTVSIVTYAGSAGTVLEPTRASNKTAILAALDRLEAGGRTAGEAGIREAYRLAEENLVEDGVNRILLATDGDFNVGQTSDGELERLVEEKRRGGVHLSVLGFGRGNLNDAMMQTLAQNGNGAAAYIDTLAEAEKVLVEEASSTLFPIAADVKIQVEFNPDRIAEYRLIGYETRALAREDFNNDRVDAGEIGSGHSVTAIYEITPKGSPAQMMDDLRYGSGSAAPSTQASDELAFVKLRYKEPGETQSKLIETPVTAENVVDGFEAAPTDVRFSVAVAAFGQKLRGTDAFADYGYDRIMEIATAARGADPFGYRAEFLSLVRLASALDGGR